jgi:hypothetical protein
MDSDHRERLLKDVRPLSASAAYISDNHYHCKHSKLSNPDIDMRPKFGNNIVEHFHYKSEARNS